MVTAVKIHAWFLRAFNNDNSIRSDFGRGLWFQPPLQPRKRVLPSAMWARRFLMLHVPLLPAYRAHLVPTGPGAAIKPPEAHWLCVCAQATIHLTGRCIAYVASTTKPHIVVIPAAKPSIPKVNCRSQYTPPKPTRSVYYGVKKDDFFLCPFLWTKIPYSMPLFFLHGHYMARIRGFYINQLYNRTRQVYDYRHTHRAASQPKVLVVSSCNRLFFRWTDWCS